MQIVVGKDERKIRSPFEDVKKNTIKKLARPVEKTQERNIDVKVDSWQICKRNNSYFVNSAGCGAVKVFVKSEQTEFSIVFHCYGTKNSIYAAKQIANYILNKNLENAKVEILNIQPFVISKDVADCVHEIAKELNKSISIKIREDTLCLNNLKEKKHSRFINICLDGNKKDILKRFEKFVLKDKELSLEDRKRKIELFQKIPRNLRTDELIKKWSSLDAKQAEHEVEQIYRRIYPFRAFLADVKKIFVRCLRMAYKG